VAVVKVQFRAVVLNNLLIAMHTYLGLGYLLGSQKATSPTYRVAFSWLPAAWWGWLILAGAALSVAAPWVRREASAALHILATLPLLAFAAALIAVEVAGDNAGWGGPALFLLPSLMHTALIHARYDPGSGRA
jgi:hypothetical protein